MPYEHKCLSFVLILSQHYVHKVQMRRHDLIFVLLLYSLFLLDSLFYYENYHIYSTIGGEILGYFKTMGMGLRLIVRSQNRLKMLKPKIK
jgi:hypothetical protein